MKKLLLLFTTLLLIISCSPSEDNTIPFHIEFLQVKDVEAPQSVKPGYEYDVQIFYQKPTSCHQFEGFYYDEEGPEHTIALQMMVLEAGHCQPAEQELEEVKFRFKCKNDYPYDHYKFKFYNGEDEDGNQSFYELHVPVLQ